MNNTLQTLLIPSSSSEFLGEIESPSEPRLQKLLEEAKNEYELLQNKKNIFLQNLENIVRQNNSVLEGNCFYRHASLSLYPVLYTKQINLFFCGKLAEKRICEIGFNAGHSSMLLLLGHELSQTLSSATPEFRVSVPSSTPPLLHTLLTPLSTQPLLQFTIFDLGDHSYILPCLQYIQSQFSQVDFEFIKGDSTITIPQWMIENNDKLGTYDLIHIDGGHSEHCIKNDFLNVDLMIKVGGVVIIDDSDMPDIKKYIEKYLSSGNYVELDVLKTIDYTHRIIQKIK